VLERSAQTWLFSCLLSSPSAFPSSSARNPYCLPVQSKALVTHYSGYDAPGIALSFIEVALREQLGSGTVSSEDFKGAIPVHASDIDPNCRQVFLEFQDTCGTSVFLKIFWAACQIGFSWVTQLRMPEGPEHALHVL
jgi:hypothetical protein